MKKKSFKVAAAAAAYTPTSSTKVRAAESSGIRYAAVEDVRKMNARLMTVHHKVLQKLAQ